MKIKKIMNLENEVVPFGFVLNTSKSLHSLDTILQNMKDSLFIYDAKVSMMKSILSLSQKFMNNPEKKFVAIVNHSTLKELKDLGLRSGVTRASKSLPNHTMIYVDKKDLFIVINREFALKVTEHSHKEIFNYFKHVFWTKCDYEVIQGLEMNELNAARLSVVRPIFEFCKHDTEISSATILMGTKQFAPSITLLNDQTSIDHPAKLIHSEIMNVFIDKSNSIWINAFENLYVNCHYDESLMIGSSFENLPRKDLLNKTILINGKKTFIKERIDITKTYFLPVNEYRLYQPNLEELVKDKQNELTLSINCEIDLLPKHIDQSYQLSSRYKTIENLNYKITENIKRLIKLVDDENNPMTKQLINITNIKILEQKIVAYESILSTLSIGDDSLLNQKNTSFHLSSINKANLIVPSDLIGTLYEKSGKQYLAINNEEFILQALTWAKENNQIVELVLKNEKN